MHTVVPPPPPPPPPPTATVGVTDRGDDGDRRREVNLLNLPAQHAQLHASRALLAVCDVQRRATGSGTLTTSFLREARRGLANAVRPVGAAEDDGVLAPLALKFGR